MVKYWVDEDGNFGGFLTEEEEAMNLAAMVDYAEHVEAEWLAEEAAKAASPSRDSSLPLDDVPF